MMVVQKEKDFATLVVVNTATEKAQQAVRGVSTVLSKAYLKNKL
jgi:hypothetical protein